MNGNANYSERELETIKRTQEKLESSFAEMKVELKAMNSRMNNTERKSDLKDRIMEITQSKQQMEYQTKKKEKTT